MDAETRSLFSSKIIIWLSALALLALALLLFTKTWAIGSELRHMRTDVPTITVTGTGKVSTPPTIAEVRFTIDERATTEKDAQSAATKKEAAALAALKKAGVADKDIQADGYQVSPQYETKPCVYGAPCAQGNTVIGYQVMESVSVKVRDVGTAGDVVKAVTDAGVQNVSGPDYRVDDPTEVEAEARGKAIDDAHQKAAALARQLGVSLGGVVSFSENSGGFPVYPSMMAKSADSAVGAPAPSLPQGETETSVTVSVSYEIK